MIVLGVTGSVGTGKSTVSKMFEKLGAVRISADALAHEAIEKGKAPYRRVVRSFGKVILDRDGSIRRRELAKIVFQNPKKLKTLNSLIHPYVIGRIREKIRRLRKRKGVVVVEIPLLHEAGLEKMFDQVVTVSCRPEAQKKRWRKNGREIGELKRRSSAQLPLSYKIKQSDFIIDNSGQVQATKRQVIALWRAMHR